MNRFLREADGAITVEAVLWVPVYLVFFALITDVSLMFHGYSKALRVAQDTNRQASTGYYVEETDLEAITLANLQSFAPNATVKTTLDELAASPHVITNISVPSSDLLAVGLIGVFAEINIQVSSVHLLEL
ncbi:TadE family protein [uncultured Boseongicola sp.]|uniref:TadE/TadG family type IV pilus assembly protein n=1 Tax=uncultured Boseongicola sp. TaxID=1648499 RepID=UPI00261D1E30|nr:TadE family protein [uncultured Boseongicola sp.]